MVKPAVIDKRRKLARKLIQETVAKGQRIGGRDGLKNLLNKEAEDLALDDGFFDVLSEKDLVELLTDAVDFASDRNAQKAIVKPSSSGPRDLETIPGPSSSARSIPPLPPSPPRSDTTDDLGKTPLESRAQDEDVESPSYEDPDIQFYVRAYHPRQGDFVLLKASWCEQKTSFISNSIVKRYKLYSYMQNGGKMKLTWEMQDAGEEMSKTVGTVFQVIDDEKINHDIAIGTAWNSEEDNEIKEDEDEDDESVHEHDDQSDDRDDSDGYIHIDEDVVKLGPRHTFPPGPQGSIFTTGLSDSQTRTISQIVLGISREQEREELAQFYAAEQTRRYHSQSKRRVRSFEGQNPMKQSASRKPKSKP